MPNIENQMVREYKALVRCNSALLRATDEKSLLNEICDLICKEAGYRMAWVGYAQNDIEKSILPVAWAGSVGDYLENITLTWADNEYGQGPTGVAIRTGKTQYIHDFGLDSNVHSWSEAALKQGYACSIALPLQVKEDQPIGALMVCSAEVNHFAQQEIKLLEQFAADLSYGIRTLRGNKELASTQALFETAFRSNPSAMAIVDRTTSRYIDVNTAWAEITGYDLSEVIGQEEKSFISIQSPPAEECLTEQADPTHGQEAQFYAKDGQLKTVIAQRVEIVLDTRASVLSSWVDITKRKAAERALVMSTRALKALSGVSEAVARASDEMTLLSSVCEVIVADGDYPLAWVGYIEHDEHKTVRIPAGYGQAAELLNDLFVSWGDGPFGQGAVGKSIRAKRPIVVKNMQQSEEFSVWQKQMQAWNLNSVISFPLTNVKATIFGVLVVYSGSSDAFENQEVERLTRMAEDLSLGIRAIRSRARVETMLHSIVTTMGKVVEARDPYTQGHEERVAKIARLIAEEVGLSPGEVDGIEVASLVHDIGKLTVPAEILTKPGKISAMEFELIKEHSHAGYDILKDIDFDWPVASIVLQHHERKDGSGYPEGMAGNEIMLEASIIGAADVIEAVASHRPYRPAMGLGVAVSEVVDHPEKFDPRVIAACLKLNAEKKFELLQ